MRTTYVGMDIHKNFIQAAAMDQAGNHHQGTTIQKRCKRHQTIYSQSQNTKDTRSHRSHLHLVPRLRNTGCSWRRDNPREHEADKNNRRIQDKNR